MNISNQKTNYFTAGEFAHLCKVNKQTLIYYDRIGLFSPIYKDEKGYRYYSVSQYDFFSVIELLKEIGMPLKEIQHYMANKSPDRFIQLMQQQKDIVRLKLENLQRIEQTIDLKLQAVQEAKDLSFTQITTEYCAARTLYLSNPLKNTTEEQFVTEVSDFINNLDETKLDTGLPIGAVIRREQVLSREVENYAHLYMEQPYMQKRNGFFQTKEGVYVIGYHIGEAEHIGKTYEKLFRYIDMNAYKIGEYAYEEYVYDAVLKNNEADYITKIMIETTTNN